MYTAPSPEVILALLGGGGIVKGGHVFIKRKWKDSDDGIVDKDSGDVEPMADVDKAGGCSCGSSK